jgi:hypothetical protein
VPVLYRIEMMNEMTRLHAAELGMLCHFTIYLYFGVLKPKFRSV